ncbi:uncharacterized protein LOC121419687 [Lytechinus variegatus]|uniref:uncharacterized protein LOC121419687 n=1 Tax=Lytechinus variegatus TaxID=7654 RepID=UPI001BB0FB99|nr:uncharacterized protein LOC121419687 [Lytechinus variegatus]
MLKHPRSGKHKVTQTVTDDAKEFSQSVPKVRVKTYVTDNQSKVINPQVATVPSELPMETNFPVNTQQRDTPLSEIKDQATRSAGNQLRYFKVNVGESVHLLCDFEGDIDSIDFISWKGSDGVAIFFCSQDAKTKCQKNTTVHTLGTNQGLVSNLTIRNTSFADEDIYSVTATAPARKTCCISLTVNVPLKGLLVIDKVDQAVLHNQSLLTVAEGQNTTLVCKTSGSVKPPVNLEWDVSVGIIIYDDLQENKNVAHDGRLTVPTRTIVFTPLYNGTDELEVVCRVANESYRNITTSVIITKEGKTPQSYGGTTTQIYVGTTPLIRHLVTISEESNPSLTSDEEVQDNCALLRTVIYILGGSLGAMILSVIAVTVSHKCLQHNTAGDADTADGVSVTAMQQDLNHEPLYENSTMSKPSVGGDPPVSRSDVVPKQPIQDSHEYMEMMPISLPRISSNHQTSQLGNSSSLNPKQSAYDSSLQGDSTLDIILNSCDVGYISCNSGPATFPQQGIALKIPDSVITTYL